MLLFHLQELVIELVQGNGNLRVCFLHIEGEFTHGRQRMDHGGDGAYPVKAIEAENGLWHIWKAYKDSLAGLYAKGVEAAGHPVYLLRKAGIACGLAHKSQCREILFPCGSLQHSFRYGFLAVVKVRVHSTVAFHPRSGNVIDFIFHKP